MILVVSYYLSALSEASIPAYLLCLVMEMMLDYETVFFKVFYNSLIYCLVLIILDSPVAFLQLA